MTPLLLAILAHAASELVFQTEKMAREKKRMELQSFARHGAAVFLCTYTALHFYGLKSALCLSLLISISHILIDLLNNKTDKGGKPSWAAVYKLFAGQCAHLLLIIVLVGISNLSIDLTIAGFYSAAFPAINIPVFVKNYLIAVFYSDKLLLIIIAFLYVVFGGAVLTRMVIDVIFPKTADNTVILGPMPNQVGKYIGILERSIIFVFILYGSLTAVAFVLTAKSIARFNELKDRDFAEYYIIGTLVSSFIAILGGLLVKELLPIFFRPF